MSYQPPFDGNWLSKDAAWSEYNKPQSVRSAVTFMYVGAGIQIIVGFLAFAALDNIKNQIARLSATPFTPIQLNEIRNIAVSIVVIHGLAGITWWLWMARKNSAGRPWARIVASVLFGLCTVEVCAVIVASIPVTSKMLPLATWVVGLCAIVLLWQRESSEYFRAQSRAYSRSRRY